MEAYWVSEAGTKSLSEDAAREMAARDDGVLWVHLDHEDERGMALLTELVKVKPADLRDCHARSPVPKLKVYTDHYFSAINGLARGTDERLHFQPLKIFLTKDMLFTLFGPHHPALTTQALNRDLDAVRRRLEAGEVCPRSGFELGATIRLEILRAQEELVSVAATRIAQLELNIMKLNPIRAEGLLDDLFGLRHDLQTIRTNAAQTHELFVHLTDLLGSQDDLLRLDPRTLGELRRGFSHLRNTTDLEREYLQEVLDLFQTRVSTELNRFVRKITAVGTIGIAWTVIAGIYGMNFEYMPELGWRLGYPMTIAVMVAVGLALAVLFRRRGWL
jgi:magnesium transporter